MKIFEIIFSQTEFAVIFIYAVMIAGKFYKWRGDQLRIILIWFFIAMGIDFGINWVYYFFWDIGLLQWDEIFLRDLTHLLTMVMMVFLYNFMNKKNEIIDKTQPDR